ncbi:MAG: 5-formyltetrahydrofolate cyclo-ligase [Candidatus Omnitrophica bacterium]|nr:5-formyltetrahydrofolate cyclo-ligase [Candidatus Omnitrophota bacterium]
MTKAALRQAMLRRLKRQSVRMRRRHSAAILRQVQELPAFRRARTIACYASLPYEVQTDALIRAALRERKRVLLPVAHPATSRLAWYPIQDVRRDLQRGAYGIREPRSAGRRSVSAKAVQLVIIPGVVFDRSGARLGHGGGYYDRWLRQIPRRVPRVGLAYACQVVDRLPVQRHDRPMDIVVSG